MGRRKIHESVREDAKELYLQGWTQQDIARFLGTTEKTITGWKQEENWEGLKLSVKSINENSYYILARLVQLQKDNVDKLIKGEIKTMDADLDASIRTYRALVQKQEIRFAQASNIIKKFMEYVMNQDLQLAKNVKPIANEYILELQKLLSQQ
jgi:transposase